MSHLFAVTVPRLTVRVIVLNFVNGGRNKNRQSRNLRNPLIIRREDEMSLDDLYRTLRGLVSEKYRIEIRDGMEPTVAIVPDSYTEKFPWTKFEGISLEDSIQKAITKLKNPSMDYRQKPNILDSEGHLWLANEDSIYSEKHTRLFLKEAEEALYPSLKNQGVRTP